MRIGAHLSVSGRVQGVGYRAFVRDEAVRHGLSGWVRNRSDLTVEAVLCGEAEAVEAVIAACRTGPRRARVDKLERLGEVAPVSGPFEVLPDL